MNMTDQEEHRNNPFSFKSFLKRTADGGGGDEAEEGKKKGKRSEGGRMVAKGDGKMKKSGRGGVRGLPFPEVEEAQADATGRSGENPFSFKKFVRRTEEKVPTRPSDLSSGSESDDDKGLPFPRLSGNITLDPPAPLPPVVPTELLSKKKKKNSVSTAAKKSAKKQSHRHESLFTDSEDSSSGEATLPLLAGGNRGDKDEEADASGVVFDPLGVQILGTDNTAEVVPGIREATRASGGAPVSGEAVQKGANSELKVKIKSGLESSSSESELGHFSDILTEGDGGRGMAAGSASGGCGTNSVDLIGSAQLMRELRELKSEHERLKVELRMSQEQTQQERNRTKSLKEKIKVLKKKEAEDTKALEDMVQRVEENLVATTKRASSAEVIIAQLKQEVQSLQTQLTQASPQSVHQHYEEILRGVREKATFASQNLSAAAAKADHSIRELLTGVETLKNAAEVLEFIDRISEVKQK